MVTTSSTVDSSLNEQAQALAQTFKNMPAHMEMGDFYDNMDPEVYNEMLKVVNFTEKDIIARQVHEALKLPKDSDIFDVGCGPGVIAEMLKKEGYNNIDGADASEKFIAHCESTGWYRDLGCFYFGANVLPDKFKNKFDCVTASGVFLPNHFPPAALDDIHVCLKVGGYMVTAMRSYLYIDGDSHGYKDKFNELVRDGKFKVVSKGDFTRGSKGGIELFSEQPSIFVVMQKLL
jgi:SAM-dependent methyltransferase